MRKLVRRHFGLCLGLTVLLPLALVILTGPVQAQKFGGAPGGYTPPTFPSPQPPAFQPPKFPSTQPPAFPGTNPTFPGTNPTFPGSPPPTFPGTNPTIPGPPSGFPGSQPPFGNPSTNPQQHKYSYTCGKCGASLGTSNSLFAPTSQCPACGVKIRNGVDGSAGIGGKPSAPPAGMPTIPGGQPMYTPPPTGNPGQPVVPPVQNPMPGSNPGVPNGGGNVVPINPMPPTAVPASAPAPTGTSTPTNNPSEGGTQPLVAQSTISPLPFLIAGILVVLVIAGGVIAFVVVKVARA